MTKPPIAFEVSVSGRNDGTIEAAYVYFTHARVSETREIIEDVLLADYDSSGKLVGFEILQPVKLNQLTRLVPEAHRAPFRRFIRKAAPGHLILST